MDRLLKVKKKKNKDKKELKFVTITFLHSLGLFFITIASPISF